MFDTSNKEIQSDDEVLLDDSLRYVERAVAAGVDARADVWMGMPHGFPEASED